MVIGLCMLPVAVVTISDWFVSGLSWVESSPAESFTAPHTCQPNTQEAGLTYVSYMVHV